MNVPKMPTPTMMINAPKKRPWFVTGYRSPYPTVEMVTMTYHTASDADVMFAPARVLLNVEHLETAELKYQNSHEEQGVQRASGAVLHQATGDVLTP